MEARDVEFTLELLKNSGYSRDILQHVLQYPTVSQGLPQEARQRSRESGEELQRPIGVTLPTRM